MRHNGPQHSSGPVSRPSPPSTHDRWPWVWHPARPALGRAWSARGVAAKPAIVKTAKLFDDLRETVASRPVPPDPVKPCPDGLVPGQFDAEVVADVDFGVLGKPWVCGHVLEERCQPLVDRLGDVDDAPPVFWLPFGALRRISIPSARSRRLRRGSAPARAYLWLVL
jgi:hypothetical protein